MKKSVSVPVISQQTRAIPYIKEWKLATGSINAALLLRQIVYWTDDKYSKNQTGWFFKFSTRPSDDNSTFAYVSDEGKGTLYQNWSEELGFSYAEIKTAMSSPIFQKIKSSDKEDLASVLKPETVVVYFKAQDNRTWYYLIPDRFDHFVVESAKNQQYRGYTPESNNVEFGNSIKSISDKAHSLIRPTETTTETTTESTKIPRSTSGKPSVDSNMIQTKVKNPAKKKEPHHNQQSPVERSIWGIVGKHFSHNRPDPEDVRAAAVIAEQWVDEGKNLKDFSTALVGQLHISQGQSFLECAKKVDYVA